VMRVLHDFKTKRLVVCFSPLQAYLWLIIARQEQISAARILYITSNNTIKDKYYFNELRTAFQNVEYVDVSGGIWKSVRALRARLRTIDTNSKCDELHIASFNTFFSMYIMKICNPTNVILYDDGIFTILSDCEREIYRFKLSKFPFLKRLAYRIMLGAESDQIIIDKVSKFNTIFPEHQSLVKPNLISSIILKKQFSKNITDIDCSLQEVGIFIGDTINELPQEMAHHYKEVINSLEFDYFLPHPRSRNEDIAPEKVIKLPTIAEEYILTLLEKGKSVTIYSFASSVLFTIGNHIGLKKVILFHPAMTLPSLHEQVSFFGIVRAEFDMNERKLIFLE